MLLPIVCRQRERLAAYRVDIPLGPSRTAARFLASCATLREDTDLYLAPPDDLAMLPFLYVVVFFFCACRPMSFFLPGNSMRVVDDYTPGAIVNKTKCC